MNFQNESVDGNSVTEQVARRFLLGDLEATERERIERLFLTVPEIRETILLVEDDLLEDYLEGSLTRTDAEKFRTSYAKDSAERRRLRITAALREHALTNSGLSSPRHSVFDRLRFALTRGPARWRIALPVFATLALVIVIASVWFGVRMNRIAREQNQLAAAERQLAEANSPANMSVKPAGMLSATIAPVSVRSGRSSAELSLQADSQIIELTLIWLQNDDYTSYQAELSRVGGTTALKLPPLKLEQRGDRVVRVRLPVELLSGGLYRINLKGLRPDGAGPSEEYDFLVVHK